MFIIAILFVLLASLLLPLTLLERLVHWGDTGDESLLDRRRAQLGLLIGIATLTAVAAMFQLLSGTGLEQTAALFVGIPATLAAVTVFIPTRSATGLAVKMVTIGLLISLLFLGEGILCVLISAPLFYLIAIFVGGNVDQFNNRDDRYSHRTFSWLGVLLLVPMSLEGVTPLTTIARDVTVSETRVVHASADAVAAAIRQQPRFDRKLPAYLGIGFPRPTFTWIDEHHWVIRMRGGEMRLNGMEPRAGNLHLAVDEEGPGRIRWRAVSDDSHMTHFLNWQASQVEWQAIDAQTTRVTWTLQYRRGLDPAWYFGPMERYAVGLAAGYLIDAVATP